MFGLARSSPARSSRQGAADAATLYKELDQRIADASHERMANMAQAVLMLPDGWQHALESHFAFLVHVSTLRAAMRRARHGSPIAAPDERRLRFYVSTLFLRECFHFLTGDPMRRERLHLVTGPTTPEGIHVPSCMIKVDLEQQSAAYVAADPLATHKQLVALTERDGHQLLMVFHSHIMHGAASTQPSQTDITTQQRFAAIGWDAVGGIFSLDGFIRFYSTCKDFSVELYGNGADIVSAAARETIVKLAIEP